MNRHNLIWLGHGTFLLKHASGLNIMFDPWLEENPSFPQDYNLPPIDLILITHGHFDHIASTPQLCKSQNNKPIVVGIFELCTWLSRKGVNNCEPMNKGGTISLLGIDITMVHADHSCGITEDDGSIVYGGEAVGYVVRIDKSNVLYFAGDTNVFDGMKLISELYTPNIACLPVGDRFTMGPKEVIKAIDLLNVEKVIPMHFGTFPELTGSPEKLLLSICDTDTDIVIPKVGVAITLET